jgi:hypothetical protein
LTSTDPTVPPNRLRRVAHNLRQGMLLAWVASPTALVRFSLLGIISSAMPPLSVYLGAQLVNRIANARLQTIGFNDLLPVLIGLWLVTALQRAIGAYMGYGATCSCGVSSSRPSGGC